MIINKDIFKPLKRGKKIKLSWLTKLKNSEFVASTSIIYDLCENAIKEDKYLSPNALKMLGDLIQQISNLKPTQRPHELTQTINTAHNNRKKQLTAIKQQLKIIISNFEVLPSEQVKSAIRVGDRLQGIYGTRHYDLGISKLTAKMSTMFLILENDEGLLKDIEQCNIMDAVNELRQSHETVIEATLQRDIEMGERDLEPSFVELRAEIYKHIKAIVQFIEAKIIFNFEIDIMLNANYMLYNYINPKQANYKQQATKRRLARERQQLGYKFVEHSVGL